MTVFDASVYVDALVVTGEPGDVARAALRDVSVFEAPSIFCAEALSALRGMLARGELERHRADGAVERVLTVHAVQYPFQPFTARVWALRHNLTVYDAWYVALAEWLETTLVTADEPLATAPGPRCQVLHVRDAMQ